jgi:hypothetical protein
MNAKKKNPKPVGKTQQKRSKPNALPQPDPLRRELGQTLEIELERQEKLKRKLQALAV